MAVKKVTYVEPEDYFTPEMKRAFEKAQKTNAGNNQKKTAEKPAKKK